LDEFDDHFIWLDLYARNVGVDEAPIIDRGRQLKAFTDRTDDQRLDLGCGHPAYRPGALRLTLEQDG
jgi:hypothetical protein